MAAHAEAAEKDKIAEAAFDELLAAEGEESEHIKPLEAAWDATGTALNDCCNALLVTPAPDHAAVLWKLRILFSGGDMGQNDEYISAWKRELTRPVLADMERLQSEFAEAWLAKWTEHGGTVLLYDGKAQFSYPADSGEPMRESGCGEQADRQDACWNDGRYHGVMNTHHRALKAVPGGADIIKAHMSSRGEIQRGRGLTASIGQLVGAVIENLEVTEGEAA